VRGTYEKEKGLRENNGEANLGENRKAKKEIGERSEP